MERLIWEAWVTNTNFKKNIKAVNYFGGLFLLI